MTFTFVPIGEPARLPETRACYRQAIRDAAPLLPAWLANALARVLAAPEMSSDALLIVADALDAAAGDAVVEGFGVGIADDLRRIADLPRGLARHRAHGEI